MRVNKALIQAVLSRTDGNCHLCHRAVGPRSYAHVHSPLGWELDHSRPRSRGGSDRLNNLYAAHIRCNRSKGANSTRSARQRHGYTAAPLSTATRRAYQSRAMIFGAAGGSLVGFWVADQYELSDEKKWLVVAACGIAGAWLAFQLVRA